MNLGKSKEIYNPTERDDRVYIIGCGATGSAVAVLLARLGVKHLVLYDDDIVEEHNLANQAFVMKHIGMKKVNALKDIIEDINEITKVTTHEKRATVNMIPADGSTVITAVDSMDWKRNWYKTLKILNNIKVDIIDPRMGLFNGTIIFKKATDSYGHLIAMSGFTDAEADALEIVGACGMTLSVYYNVNVLASLLVSEFVKGIPNECIMFNLEVNKITEV